jgi:SAM-dependent methyltransferase
VGALTAQPKLYGELASWFHLLTAPEDYAKEAGLYQALIDEFVPDAETMLELGSGGGNNASHLKARYALTLVDQSPQMLELSLSLNPDCEHIVGDMRSVRLGRAFDSVFVHDAVAYIVSESDLRLVIDTAYLHCRPGGVALFVPDHVRETFRPSTRHGGHDGESRGLRYLEWTWDPNADDTTYCVDFAYLLREEEGLVRSVHDRHTCGLFPRDTWLAILEQTGFEANIHKTTWTDEGNELFVAVKS